MADNGNEIKEIAEIAKQPRVDTRWKKARMELELDAYRHRKWQRLIGEGMQWEDDGEGAQGNNSAKKQFDNWDQKTSSENIRKEG